MNQLISRYASLTATKTYNYARIVLSMGNFTTGLGPNMAVVTSLVLLFALYFAKQLFEWVRKHH